MDCRFYERRSVGSANNLVRCWTWNHVGYIATHCHTMRCYSCSGFGHKAQDCVNSRRQPMRNASYTSARKTYDPWKKNDVGRNTAQKTNAQNQGYSQVWMKKNELLNVNEVD